MDVAITLALINGVGIGLANYWTYRNRKQSLANELQIALLHDCLHEARTEQQEMHAENKPVIAATLATVKAIRQDQEAEPVDGK